MHEIQREKTEFVEFRYLEKNLNIQKILNV